MNFRSSFMVQTGSLYRGEIVHSTLIGAVIYPTWLGGQKEVTYNSLAEAKADIDAEVAALNWPVIGLILAGELIYATIIAVLTRILSKSKLPGQTFGLVVAGVAGVVVIAGAQIGWSNVTFLCACFSVAGLVMGIEYYTRVLAEQKEAQQALEDSIHE